MFKPDVDLVFFSCVNREHLLLQAAESFEQACSYQFSQRILALDGYIDPQCIAKVNPSKLVQNYHRQGYIRSILNALNLIETEYFFWLEDDLIFQTTVDIDLLIQELQQHSDWVQILFSHEAPLSLEEKQYRLSEGVVKCPYGFSARPSLCRTSLVKAGFQALVRESRDREVGFEPFMTEWCELNQKICTLLDPGDAPAYIHIGYLESTPRQWHMTASLDGEVTNYLSGFRHTKPPSLIRKFLMLVKLTFIFCRISLYQFWNRAAYDLAFRITVVGKEHI